MTARPPVTLRPEIAALAAYRQGRHAARMPGSSSPRTRTPSRRCPRCPTVPQRLAQQPVSGRGGVGPARAARRAARRDRRRGPRRRPAPSRSSPSCSRPPRTPATRSLYAWRAFEAYPGLVTVAGADQRPGAEPARRRPRSRRHGRGDHRPHPHRDRLLAEQPDRRHRHRPPSSSLHGEGARDRARAARRGLPSSSSPTRRRRRRARRCSSATRTSSSSAPSRRPTGSPALRVGYAIGAGVRARCGARPRRSRSR